MLNTYSAPDQHAHPAGDDHPLVAPALHLQEADRRGAPHREDREDQPEHHGLLARSGGAADPQFVVVPEVAGVEHVAPADHQHAVDQGVVGDQVQRPAEAVEHSVDQDQVADQGDDHRPHRQAGARRLALQPHAAHEDGEADEPRGPHAHQTGADDHPLVGPALRQPRLLVVVLEADRAAVPPAERRDQEIHSSHQPRAKDM